jgi:hypothetical protein
MPRGSGSLSRPYPRVAEAEAKARTMGDQLGKASAFKILRFLHHGKLASFPYSDAFLHLIIFCIFPIRCLTNSSCKVGLFSHSDASHSAGGGERTAGGDAGGGAAGSE